RSSSVGSDRRNTGCDGAVRSGMPPASRPGGIGGSLCRGVYRQGAPGSGTGTYDVDMDNRAEVREFLMSRRAKLTPDGAGIAAGSSRRVPGLRRTEVATLAGVRVGDYAHADTG